MDRTIDVAPAASTANAPPSGFPRFPTSFAEVVARATCAVDSPRGDATSIRRFPNSTSDCYDSPRNHSVRTLPTASRYNITLHEHYAIVETTIPLYRTSR